jgi:hypothetical protein
MPLVGMQDMFGIRATREKFSRVQNCNAQTPNETSCSLQLIGLTKLCEIIVFGLEFRLPRQRQSYGWKKMAISVFD